MTDHYHVGVLLDEFAVRIKFHLVELLTALFNDGETIVRVCLGVAVTREVFDGSANAAVLHPVHIQGRFAHHFVSVFAKRTAVDHRIAAVVVDVDAWCKVEVDAYCLALLSHFKSHPVDQ